jgi:hypothetical protein
MSQFIQVGTVWVNLDQVASINIHFNKTGAAETATIEYSNGRKQPVSKLDEVNALHVFLQQHLAK